VDHTVEKTTKLSAGCSYWIEGKVTSGRTPELPILSFACGSVNLVKQSAHQPKVSDAIRTWSNGLIVNVLNKGEGGWNGQWSTGIARIT
jgi:hypothetical protein